MDTTKNAIEVTNLVKRYKELVALDHFNLTVKTGEIFGLLGPNGYKGVIVFCRVMDGRVKRGTQIQDRKSTRLNSSHLV